MNPYTSLWTGVTPGDGPQEFHLVLLDNGRTDVLADEVGRAALHCIRCSACLNVCPVYERVGGHAYGSVYPGPIGAILTPQLTKSSGGLSGHHDPNASLPYASTLCGACYEVCPVKIDIPSILVELRAREVDADRGRPTGWGAAMKAASFVMSDARRFELAEKAAGSDAWSPGRRAGSRPPAARVRVDPLARPPGAREADLPRLVARPPVRRAPHRGRRGPVSARDDVLARVRTALGGSTATAGLAASGTAPRAYREHGELAPGSPEVVDVLVDRLVDYRAHVHRAETSADVATVVADLLVDATSVVVPAGLDAAWLAALGAGTAVVRTRATTRARLTSSTARTPSSPRRASRSATPARSCSTASRTRVAARSRSSPTCTCASCARTRWCSPCPRPCACSPSTPSVRRRGSADPARRATSSSPRRGRARPPHPARRPRPTEVELRPPR